MAVAGNLLAQPLQHPPRIALGSKKDRTVVVINSDHLKSPFPKEQADFGSYESAGAGDPNGRCDHK